MDIVLSLYIVLLLLVIHIIIPLYFFDSRRDVLKVIDHEKTPDILDTGDIVFFRSCNKCKLGESYIDNLFLMTYRNLYNSFREIVVGDIYTHCAIIMKIRGVPYIVHIDGGTMYDAILQKNIKGNSCVVSDLKHINERGGLTHVFKYIGSRPSTNTEQWISHNRNIRYPNQLRLVLNNGLGIFEHDINTQACTDFVEYVLISFDILKKNDVSKRSTLKDIHNIVVKHPLYIHIPYILKNKCYDLEHM
jgi:hypothetical protein